MSTGLALPDDLSLLLGMNSKAVLVRLSDSSVHEIEISSSAAPKRNGSTASAGSTSGGSATGLASSLSTRARVSAVAKVTAFVESRQAVPAGMRGVEGGNLAVGRRVDQESADSTTINSASGPWVGLETLTFDTTPPSHTSATLSLPLRHLYLLTRGSATHLLHSPLGLHAFPSSPNASHSSRQNVPPPPIQPQSIHTFLWPTNVTRVVPLLRRRALKREVQDRGEGRTLLALVGFTTTGVSIQEGVVDLGVVERLFAPGGGGGVGGAGSRSTKALFTPTRSYTTSPLESERILGSPDLGNSTASGSTTSTLPQPHDEDQLGDRASFDFGRETGFLCPGGPWWGAGMGAGAGKIVEDSDSEAEDEGEGGVGRERDGEGGARTRSGGFFYSRTHGDWQLKWIG